MQICKFAVFHHVKGTRGKKEKEKERKAGKNNAIKMKSCSVIWYNEKKD